MLSNPERRPIGVITSSIWSPERQMRIAQGYIVPEYAQDERDVLFNVLFDLPTHKMRPKRIGFHLRQGNLRASYRKLIPGKVVRMPFVSHTASESMEEGEQGEEHI